MRSEPLKPSASLLVKLGSIAVHTDEMRSYGFDPSRPEFHFDIAAISTLLGDAELTVWLLQMSEMAMLPVKRNAGDGKLRKARKGK